jgi:hypothetical protein
MRSRNFAVGLILFVLLLSSGAARACGDKLLILGRGVRFQVDTTDYPAAILLYMNPDAPGSQTWGDTQLQSVMKRAGHHLRSVRSREDLTESLKNGRYDIVLADISDAPGLEELLQAAPSQPVLLPWVYKGTKAAESAARQRYQFFLKAPGSVRNFLSVIDRTMESKPKLVRLRASARSKPISFSP